MLTHLNVWGCVHNKHKAHFHTCKHNPRKNLNANWLLQHIVRRIIHHNSNISTWASEAKNPNFASLCYSHRSCWPRRKWHIINATNSETPPILTNICRSPAFRVTSSRDQKHHERHELPRTDGLTLPSGQMGNVCVSFVCSHLTHSKGLDGWSRGTRARCRKPSITQKDPENWPQFSFIFFDCEKIHSVAWIVIISSYLFWAKTTKYIEEWKFNEGIKIRKWGKN